MRSTARSRAEPCSLRRRASSGRGQSVRCTCRCRALRVQERGRPPIRALGRSASCASCLAFTSILAGGGVDVLALVVIVALAVLELAALVARTLEVVVVLVVVGGGGGGQAEPSPPVTLKSASAPPADALAPVSSAGRAAGRDSAIPREAGTADNQVKLAVCPERAGRKRAVAALARGFPAADARGVSEAARAVAGKESDFAAVEVADGDIEPAAAEGADRKRFAGLFDIRMAVGSQVLDRRFKLAGALVEEHRKALFIPTPSFGFDLVRRGHEHVVAAAAAQIDGGDLTGAPRRPPSSISVCTQSLVAQLPLPVQMRSLETTRSRSPVPLRSATAIPAARPSGPSASASACTSLKDACPSGPSPSCS